MKMLTKAVCLGLVFSAASIANAQTGGFPHMMLEQVASGLDRPVFATSAPGDGDRLYVLEQHSAEIKILDLQSLT